MDLKSKNAAARVVQVSLTGVLAGTIAVVVLGMVGGALTAQLWLPRTVPVTEEGGRLVSTVQEVTISPNIAAAEMLEASERSVVMIGREGAPGAMVLATGFVVTNDGMIVTAGELPSDQLIAYDYQGKTATLERVGSDELFGLIYLRAREAVLIPIDMRSGPVPVAYELMAVSRSLPTLLPRAEFYRVSETILPPELMPAGIQQVFKGTQLAETELTGSPLIDEEGHVAGILTNPLAGLALPVNQLKESLDRVIGGQREKNRFEELGIELRYLLTATGDTAGRQFMAEVREVMPAAVAAAANLKRGDIIMRIDDTPLEWGNSVLAGLSRDLPLTLTVNRADKQEIVTLRDLGDDARD